MSGFEEREFFVVQDFVESLRAQLDRAQDSLAVSVRTGRPLTWALRDVGLELNVFFDLRAGKARMRHAGPNETGASTIKLNFATITRPMVEENTLDIARDEDPRSLEEFADSVKLDDETRTQLDRMGVRTVGQLKRMGREVPEGALHAFTGLPVGRLRAALQAAARPVVTRSDVELERDGSPLLRIQGANLTDGLETDVRVGGEPVEVVSAEAKELLVRPMSHQREGRFEVVVKGERASGFFRMPQVNAAPDAPQPPAPQPAAPQPAQHNMPDRGNNGAVMS
ncbi:MAG: hypothetical protein OXT09_03970 [Myxococcales bacterium]|nr:hypothetical protein [Myxococcales bacterium]